MRMTTTRLVSGLFLMLTAGCANSGIEHSALLSPERPRLWNDYRTLPTVIHGQIPDQAAQNQPTMVTPASGTQRYVVMYLNPAQMLPPQDLCQANVGNYSETGQAGRLTQVQAALCDKGTVVTTAVADVAIANQPPRWINREFAMVKDQLYNSLYPEANDPMQYYH